MSDDLTYGLALGCGLPVVLLIVVTIRAFFTRRERAARALRGAATTPIAELSEGASAKVVGRVTTDEPLRAPSSGRACAAYEITIEWRTSSGHHREPHRRSALRPFQIEDESGAVDVAIEDAVLVLEQDHHVSIEVATADDWVIELLADVGVHFESRELRGGVAHVREAVAEIGEQVAVMGTFSGGRLGAGDDPVRISDVESARER